LQHLPVVLAAVFNHGGFCEGQSTPDLLQLQPQQQQQQRVPYYLEDIA
jgi:hypothetical protein